MLNLRKERRLMTFTVTGAAATYHRLLNDYTDTDVGHCADGPAVIFHCGGVEFWLEGVHYETFESYVIAAEWTEDQIVEYKLTHEV